MKRNVIIIGLVLLTLVVVGAGCRYAHRKFNEKMETAQIKHQGRQMGRGQMGRGGQFSFQAPMNGRRGDMGPGPMWARRGNNMPGNGMRGGMGMGPGNRMGRNPMGRGTMEPGNMMPGRIPNLTDKQKKEIKDLRDKQQLEMLKFQQEISSKMQSMREANRNQVLNLLTDEQKKAIESGQGMRNPVPAPAK